ncbi:Gfo/Idh/MocA family protein [Streptacidiphilus neutrinimicus]|uniref:Gfo/Idh/MocA family protein n=1 Tax=Streptacidiphilus neutrinimicus TaxID=105420 RepID=UPI0005A6615E|nr:Gfo/Idh/MocA family oxidoreductase [Streptacidiphilus neutrinimicus]
MSDRLTVGLVGAGPWAGMAHAPALAAGPATELAGVWARRTEAAAELGGRFGAPAFARLEELFDACEAVAFCVPPDVQAELALRAVRAGKAVLLEKPLAMELEGARRLADAVAEAGVVSQMVLTARYTAATREFLTRAQAVRPLGGVGVFTGSLQDGPFATPWRLERGALLDLGPHLVDLLDAALGRVVAVRAQGDPLGWVALTLEHESGALSQAGMTAFAGGSLPAPRVEVFGADGHARLAWPEALEEPFTRMVAEFAQAVRTGAGHPLDARHGLRLQELLAQAEAQL